MIHQSYNVYWCWYIANLKSIIFRIKNWRICYKINRRAWNLGESHWLSVCIRRTALGKTVQVRQSGPIERPSSAKRAAVDWTSSLRRCNARTMGERSTDRRAAIQFERAATRDRGVNARRTKHSFRRVYRGTLQEIDTSATSRVELL